MTNPDNIRATFHKELDAIILAVPQSQKLLVLGDFNTRVGTNHQTWEGIIGKHGLCEVQQQRLNAAYNSNGLMLLTTATA